MFGNHTLTRAACRSLYDAGCRQGAIFRADPTQMNQDALDSAAEILASRQQSVGDRLIIVTQDCDVLSEDEPRIEALACQSITGKSDLDNYDRNSSRYFVVHKEHGLIALARDRIFFDKRLLQSYRFAPWPSDEKRFERFRRWLGRRYTRPPIPDDIVESFCTPVQQLLRSLQKSKPNLVSHFSDAFYEVRISIPSREKPPYDISALLLVRQEALTEEQIDACAEIERQIRGILDTSKIALEDFSPAAETEISVFEYFRTVPIFLENLTYRGDEIMGDEPYDEAS